MEDMTSFAPADPHQNLRVELVRSLHQSPTQIVAAMSGGGTLALADLLTVPGGSRTLIDATVPYSPESISQYIGRVPDQFCCSRTARNMAMTAFYHARHVLRAELLRKKGHVNIERISPRTVDVSHDIDDISDSAIIRASNFVEPMDADELDAYHHIIGIGCTASLVTDRQKMGDHRVYVVIQTLRRTIQFSLQCQKGGRTRWEEERLVADLILNAVETARQAAVNYVQNTAPDGTETSENFCSAFGIGSTDHFPLQEVIPLQLKQGEGVQGKQTIGSAPLVDLFFGKLGAVLWTRQGIQNFIPRQEMVSLSAPFNPHAEFTQAIFPGSFNPIHKGHLEMIDIAEQRLQNRVILEMSIQNVDKPPLDYIELEHRLNQIGKAKPNQAVWLTQTPLFSNKAALFRGTTFIVGADTLKRFANLRFYHENTHELHDVLRMIAFHNCRFLVFARQGKSNLEALDSLPIPDMLRSLCDDVPPSVFTMNISSSDLRKKEL
jgi:cytidyltransferase-like protein